MIAEEWEFYDAVLRERRNFAWRSHLFQNIFQE